jgi:hypothetical protein
LFNVQHLSPPDLSVVANFAMVDVFLHVRLAHEPALVAHMNLECIGLIEQTFFQEVCGTMRDNAIAFHLAEP